MADRVALPASKAWQDIQQRRHRLPSHIYWGDTSHSPRPPSILPAASSPSRSSRVLPCSGPDSRALSKPLFLHPFLGGNSPTMIQPRSEESHCPVERLMPVDPRRMDLVGDAAPKAIHPLASRVLVTGFLSGCAFIFDAKLVLRRQFRDRYIRNRWPLPIFVSA